MSSSIFVSSSQATILVLVNVIINLLNLGWNQNMPVFPRSMILCFLWRETSNFKNGILFPYQSTLTHVFLLKFNLRNKYLLLGSKHSRHLGRLLNSGLQCLKQLAGLLIYVIQVHRKRYGLGDTAWFLRQVISVSSAEGTGVLLLPSHRGRRQSAMHSSSLRSLKLHRSKPPSL